MRAGGTQAPPCPPAPPAPPARSPGACGLYGAAARQTRSSLHEAGVGGPSENRPGLVKVWIYPNGKRALGSPARGRCARI